MGKILPNDVSKQKVHMNNTSLGENAISVVKSVDYQSHPYLMWKSSDGIRIIPVQNIFLQY